MDNSELVSFPLPLATTLCCIVLAVTVWRLNLGPGRAKFFFVGFFATGALASSLVALRFGYGMDSLVLLQRILPLFLGPFLFLGFKSLTIEAQEFWRLALLHLGLPFAVVGFLMVFATDLRFIDLAISASYFFYCLALYWIWRRGPDSLVHAPLNITGSVSNWLLRAIGFLLFILVLDSAIAIDFAVTGGERASKLISYGTVPLIILLLATVIALPMMVRPTGNALRGGSSSNDEDQMLLERLDSLMKTNKLYLEPDISVQRLARRLSVPARSVSAAVNKTQHMNMSHYVNRFRLDHAARLLIDTDESVTSIASQSGFMARSNFYREFQRVYGKTPIDFRASEK